MNKIEKIFNKVWPWILLILILWACYENFKNPTSRCRWVPELDDYECWDPR